MLETTVMQAKRYGVVSCTLDTLLLAAARRMAGEDISALLRDNQIHRVVVVREDGGKYHMVREHGQTPRGQNPRISYVE